MKSLALSLEEFSAKRRDAQGRIEDALRPLVRRALDAGVSTKGWDELLDEVAHQWRLVYQEEHGQPGAGMPRAMRLELLDALKKTDRSKANDTTVDRIAIWLSTAVLAHATMTASDDDAEELFMEWVTMGDSHVRATHRDTAGQIRPIGERFSVDRFKMPYPGYPGVPIELWINCVVGSTEVGWTGQDVLGATRRTHEGTFVDLRTVRGHVLTVTGNHPVLTPAGYVPAQSLREGDRILASDSPISPQVDDVPASAEQVFGALSETWVQQRVVPSRVDFHGDIPAAEVEVVRPDGDLLGPVRSELGDALLVWLDEGPAAFTRDSQRAVTLASFRQVRGNSGSPRLMGGGSVGTSLLERQSTHADAVGLAAPAHLQSEFVETTDDQRTTDSEVACHLEHALALGMTPCEIIEVKVYSATHEVFNFHTSANWYIANGIATHNCRCTLRPVLASEVNSMTASDFRDVSTDERKKDADAGRAMPDGSYPIDNCGDPKNAIQAIGRAKDPGKVKAHIKKRKNALGCPDVEIPEGWAAEIEENEMGTEDFKTKKKTKAKPKTAECAPEDMPEDEMPGDMPDDAESPEEDAPEQAPLEMIAVPWHGVLAPEGAESGDGRGFKEGSLSTRPLPLPLTWQKTSAEGHMQNVTVAKIEQAQMVGSEMRGAGTFLVTPEADEAIGLIAAFGKFGVSVDADSADFDMDAMDEENPVVWFTKARVAGACIVPIPAFHQAWVALGEAPEGFFDGGADVPTEQDAPEESMVASAFWQQFVDVAPGVTEDGPGWLTHPVDTDRLRDYWTHGEGAAKIGWGAPGDFDRCRANLAQYVKPEYLSGYCANRHKDALGVWPGQEYSARDAMEETEMSKSVSLVASAYAVPDKAPAEWFKDPEFEPGDGRLVQYKNGTYGCPQTITEEGRIFGHIATWRECHSKWGDQQCILAPHSAVNYAHFLLGEVLTTEGPVATGCLTIGTGHADGRLKWKQAAEHYDNTGAVYGDIAVGEDEYGIWMAGWVRPGTTAEMIHAARASKPSGDWRKIGGQLEMIACLAVNVPGFRVPRVAASVQDGQMLSLVAAGALPDAEEKTMGLVDTVALAAAVADEMERRERHRVAFATLQGQVSEALPVLRRIEEEQVEARKNAVATLASKVVSN